MYPNIERRVLERFQITNAKVSYKTANGKQNSVSLIDISKGSVRFEMPSPIENGRFLKIDMDFPGIGKMSIKGHIVWIS